MRSVRVIWLESEGHILPPQTRAILEFLENVTGDEATEVVAPRFSSA